MTTRPKKIYSDFRDAFFDELYLIAKEDRDVVLLMGDQGAMSFEKYRESIPSQIINAGIAEQNMISVSAGLSLGGKKVFVHSIICFLALRAYEQIKVDLSIMNLPVVLVGVGAGYAYGTDGPTHHSNQDIAVMHAVSGLTILNASDTVSLAAFAHLAYELDGPVYVRFDKGNVPPLYKLTDDFTDGLARLVEGSDLAIISTGLMVHKALAVAEELKESGVSVSVIDIYRLKPLNKKLLEKYLDGIPAVVVMEEHYSYGGLGSIVADFITDNDIDIHFKRFGIPDKNMFYYGNREYMHEKINLGNSKLISAIQGFLKK